MRAVVVSGRFIIKTVRRAGGLPDVGNEVRDTDHRVTSVQVALEHVETLRYPGEDLHRGGLIRLRVPKRSNARSTFYPDKLVPNSSLLRPPRNANEPRSVFYRHDMVCVGRNSHAVKKGGRHLRASRSDPVWELAVRPSLSLGGKRPKPLSTGAAVPTPPF